MQTYILITNIHMNYKHTYYIQINILNTIINRNIFAKWDESLKVDLNPMFSKASKKIS